MKNHSSCFYCSKTQFLLLKRVMLYAPSRQRHLKSHAPSTKYRRKDGGDNMGGGTNQQAAERRTRSRGIEPRGAADQREPLVLTKHLWPGARGVRARALTRGSLAA